MFLIENLPIKKFIVIGSYALNTRVSSDIDLICSIKDIELPFTSLINLDHTVSFTFENKKIECMLIEKQPSLKILYDSYEISNKVNYANKVDLFAIKKAHIHRANQQWLKHIHDYHNLKQLVLPYYNKYEKNCCNGLYTIEEFSNIHKETLDNLLGFQKQVPLLGITKEDFFDDFVIKYVDHDWLHEVYKHLDVPIYTKLQNDPNIVYCDPIKWSELTELEKNYCVLEECYVIATERFLIKKYIDKKEINSSEFIKAFETALIKVCTTLTSGFFRQHAIDNFFTLRNNYNKEYFQIFIEAYNKYVPSI